MVELAADRNHESITDKTRELAHSVKEQPWVLRSSDEQTAQQLAEAHKLDPVIARILSSRGIHVGEVVDYLNPSLKTIMPDPYTMQDMEVSAARLADAIMNEQTIGIFGDYDVDGVTATSLLYLYCREFDHYPEIYLPDRVADGYGPSYEAFLNLQERGAQVIVTVDCGAAAHEPIERACAAGLEVVVLDHHLMTSPPPADAVGVVNPNRPDDQSGLNNLSAVGVTFMMLVAVNRILRERGYFNPSNNGKVMKQPNLLQWLDIVALGLVCDVMDMKGLTRAFVAQGLRVMDAKSNPKGNAGLTALGKCAGVKGVPSTYHLGFLIGPRINAAGRIGHANMAFQLITSEKPEQRLRLAEQLHEMNAERRAIEGDVLEAAIAQVEEQATLRDGLPDVVIAMGEGWHQGVIGIVAGRLKEKFHRPSIVIAGEGNVGKGSGRSLDGVDLGGAVGMAREAGLLINGGGHEMAAGLTINVDRVEEFGAFMHEALSSSIHEAIARQHLKVDAVIAPSAVSARFASLVGQSGPFGPGNSEPVFMLEQVRALYPKQVGDGHIACLLQTEGGSEARAIAFRVKDTPIEEALYSGAFLHVAGRVKADEWRGGDHGQFQIMDVALV